MFRPIVKSEKPLHQSLLLSLCGIGVANAQTSPPYTGTPYAGKPHAVPGKIEAEHYDISPEAKTDVSFHYNGKIVQSKIRTTPDSIGLAKYGKGHVSTDGKPEDPDQAYVGWTQGGQWLKYTVQVSEAGTYVFGGKFAAGNKGAKISVSFSPGDGIIGPVEIPTTAGFQPEVEVYHVWETLANLGEVKLPAGIHVMTVKIESKNSGMNFDYFTLSKKP